MNLHSAPIKTQTPFGNVGGKKCYTSQESWDCEACSLTTVAMFSTHSYGTNIAF